MAIEAIGSVSASHAAPALVAKTAVVSAGFSEWLGAGVERADAGLKAADSELRTLAAGDGGSPHEVMILMEEARMNLMLLVEVRNRVVEAYQELARMQL